MNLNQYEIFNIIMLVIGPLCTGCFVLIYLYKKYVCKFTEIMGTKIGNSRIFSDEYIYRSEVEFYVKRKLYICKGKTFSLFENSGIGKKLKVIYNPQNPNDSMLERDYYIYLFLFIFLIIIDIILFFFLFVLS